VVVLRSNIDVAVGLEALELGACDHVAKPFSLPVLLQRIRHTLQV